MHFLARWHKRYTNQALVSLDLCWYNVVFCTCGLGLFCIVLYPWLQLEAKPFVGKTALLHRNQVTGWECGL